MTAQQIGLWCLFGLYCLVVGLFTGCYEPAYAEERFHGLVVEPEQRCSEYDPADYAYPATIEHRVWLTLGAPYSPYDNVVYPSLRSTDVDHLVPRSEAHDSGLCKASRAVRHAFANDLLNLALASPHINRVEKRDRDIGEWVPTENQVWYAYRWLLVKQRYDLSIDERERDALNRILSEKK